MKQRELLECQDDLQREMLEVEILEIQTHSVNAQNSVQGAIRKLNFFINQYNSLLKHLGVDEITEEMYEREENRYHIMTAMKQDCIAKCNSMKDCNNIAFVPKENRCYLRSNIISDTAPQIALKDGYTLFKHWKPGICSVFVYYDA